MYTYSYRAFTKRRKFLTKPARFLFDTHFRLENKIAEHPEHFKSFSSIRDTLGLFLFRHNLLDATEIVLENEAHLIEAAFGRIKLFGGTARTVLDEPFVLKAVKAFFQERDPLLLAAAERAMLHSTTPSVHGNMWETVRAFIHGYLELTTQGLVLIKYVIVLFS